MTGTLYGIGVGPGDPDLLTLKAYRLLTNCRIVAYPAPDNGDSFARSIVSEFIPDGCLEIPIIIPMRTERFPAKSVYDDASTEIQVHLDAGEDVVVLCEGDPFFYGSFMYLYERMAGEYHVEVVPGVSSLMASAAALGRPLAARNDVLKILPAPLPEEVIREHLRSGDAVAIIKVGRHYEKIRALIEEAGLLNCSGYLERVGLKNQKIMPLSRMDDDKAPYFSIILIYKGVEDWIYAMEMPTSHSDTPR